MDINDTEELYCDGCGAKLSSGNDNFDEDTGGHFCNDCFESFDANPDNYAVDPDFDDTKDYKLPSVFDVDDDFDAYEETADIKRSNKLTEAADDDCCAALTLAGGARAVATKYRQIISTPRNKSVYQTCVDMLGQDDVKINAMHNVVAYVHDMQEAGAVLQMIYEQFGIKGSFVLTWKGDGKLYFAPETDVDRKPVLEYDNKHPALPKIDFSSPKAYLTGGN